jgi:hypothetical protein
LHDEVIELTAKHLVDAAGRQFIIGKKTDNVIFDPEHLRWCKYGFWHGYGLKILIELFFTLAMIQKPHPVVTTMPPITGSGKVIGYG